VVDFRTLTGGIRMTVRWVAFCMLGVAACSAAVRDDAQYEKRVAELRKTTPPEFTILIEKPFVVIGNGSEASVRKWASGTIRWAVARLKEGYFKKDPNRIVDIWLFKDGKSYIRHAREIHGVRPGTPYGFYSPHLNALIMNISTGGGTLVHEIVHPFMAANFPACPDWFNEGLASLYEQSANRKGKIVGLTNWRLAGLQQAIRMGKLPTIQALCTTTSHQFRHEDPGTHYAQARYLCYFLQERGLLRRFYRQFVANQARDQGGFATLQQILKESDMNAFQKRWESWVMGLHFP
jgi:hypothetical protein